MIKHLLIVGGVGHSTTYLYDNIARHPVYKDCLEIGVSEAHRDSPVPIGHGQTISQPTLVLYMTEQLKPGGIMIIPVGDSRVQELLRVTKDLDDSVEKERIELVRFVPLVGKYEI